MLMCKHCGKKFDEKDGGSARDGNLTHCSQPCLDGDIVKGYEGVSNVIYGVQVSDQCGVMFGIVRRLNGGCFPQFWELYFQDVKALNGLKSKNVVLRKLNSEPEFYAVVSRLLQ